MKESDRIGRANEAFTAPLAEELRRIAFVRSPHFEELYLTIS